MAPSRWFGGLKMGGMAFSGGNILQRSGIATPVATPVAMASRRKVGFAGVFVAALSLSAGFAAVPAAAQMAAQPAAQAASGDLMSIYTITGVPVDATAANAVQAREKALAQGQKAAFRQLAARLSGTGAGDSVALPTDAELPSLVLGVAIENEKTSSVRYVGTIGVSFFPQAARDRLVAAGLPVFDTPAPTLVVLPIFQASPETPAQLFDETSPWKNVWSGRPRSGLTPLVVPFGDLTDMATIDAARAAGLDQTALAAIARRYHAEEAVVVRAALTGEGLNRRIDLAVARSTGTGFQAIDAVPAPPNVTLTAALDAASDAVADWLDNQWRSEAGSAVSLVGSGEMVVDIAFPGGLPEWLEIRKALSRQIVTHWTVQSLSTTQAVVALTHRGSAADMVQDMAGSGLALYENAGRWHLSKGIIPPATDAAPQPETVIIQ